MEISSFTLWRRSDFVVFSIFIISGDRKMVKIGIPSFLGSRN